MDHMYQFRTIGQERIRGNVQFGPYLSDWLSLRNSCDVNITGYVCHVFSSVSFLDLIAQLLRIRCLQSLSSNNCISHQHCNGNRPNPARYRCNPSCGITVGSVCAQNQRTSRAILSVCDFFQTFPSFIYLIPVILLFGITDTSVMIAAIVYAVIPATRYTVEGLNSVPTSLHEAGTMSGVSRAQRWINIELPLALPHIMLGINQTVVFALFMVILGALIGTIDLGLIAFVSVALRLV